MTGEPPQQRTTLGSTWKASRRQFNTVDVMMAVTPLRRTTPPGQRNLNTLRDTCYDVGAPPFVWISQLEEL